MEVIGRELNNNDREWEMEFGVFVFFRLSKSIGCLKRWEVVSLCADTDGRVFCLRALDGRYETDLRPQPGVLCSVEYMECTNKQIGNIAAGSIVLFFAPWGDRIETATCYDLKGNKAKVNIYEDVQSYNKVDIQKAIDERKSFIRRLWQQQNV